MINIEKYTPIISVIVPVYNTEKYLVRCIESILSQKFSNFELLLIDDGSQDSSGRICDQYAKIDIRIKVYHKKNGGVSSARNTGLRFAHGYWVAFCDSDDCVSSDWLLEFSKNLDCDLIVQGFHKRIIGSEAYNSIAFTSDKYYKKERFGDFLYQLDSIDNVGYLWCRLFNLQIIKDNNIWFNEKYVIWEDLNFIFQYMLFITSCRIQKAVCYYYTEPSYINKYAEKRNTTDSADCLSEIIKNYVDLVGYNLSPLFISLVDSLINCLINICFRKNVTYDLIASYVIYSRKIVSDSGCMRKLKKQSRIFLFFSTSHNVSFIRNSLKIYKILSKFI